MSNPIWIEESTGGYLNLQNVAVIRVSGKTVIAETGGRTITVMRCGSKGEAHDEMKKLMDLKCEATMTTATVAPAQTEEVKEPTAQEKEAPKKTTRRRGRPPKKQ